MRKTHNYPYSDWFSRIGIVRYDLISEDEDRSGKRNREGERERERERERDKEREIEGEREGER